MRTYRQLWFVFVTGVIFAATQRTCNAQSAARLPRDVKAVWEVSKAYRETTPTRERLCINGLWRWQPAERKTDQVPTDGWGYFKVPGSWPGITNYMQKDCQTVHAHPNWKDENLGSIAAAWYQREITVPRQWTGRRITVYAEYLNSFATVYVDGQKTGEMRFPAGEVDLTSVCRPGRRYVLSLLVLAMPLDGVMLSYNDTASAREVKGSVARRGLCGDVFLASKPSGPRVAGVKVDTSTRKGEITFDIALQGLDGGPYTLAAQIADQSRTVMEFTSHGFQAAGLQDGRFVFTEKWHPKKLWDLHTPQNQYDLQVSLLGPGGQALDVFYPIHFGFRELWIDGRDLYLNGTRIFLSGVPLDNAQVGAAAANYQAARESMERLKSFGINFVYTHNYGCQPGSHLSFAEVLSAADDVGMLVSFSQPHFGHYDWQAADADRNNGYAGHAEFYVRMAQNHPSVVFYSMSHNGCGYSEDMNPDMIDGIQNPRSQGSLRNANRALRAEAIVRRLDPGRIVYHHSSGNLSSMHTSNFYPNFVPIQELSDWFEHWATEGVKPAFTCEFGAPFTWDWTMYRGWYKGRREFGSARVPWEFCLAEWNSQFLGDRAFRISQMEKTNLRWEAKQFRAGNLWHRWDYPHQVGSRDFDERYPVFAMYLTDNWRAFRTWGLSANSPWEHGHFWKLRDGIDKSRKEFEVDWENLQRPGFSPDYVEGRYERMDLAFERSDWIPTVAARALVRNNGPVLAYIGGKPARFTSKDHNFLPGETVEKQIIVINNSRVPVTCDCAWSLALPEAVTGAEKVRVQTGQQARIPLSVPLPKDLPPGSYELTMTARFDSGETQEDEFAIHVLRPAPAPQIAAQIALFDPQGQTGRLLSEMGVRCRPVEASTDLSSYELLIVGKEALTLDGPAPNLERVREGLKVLVFEQTAEALEKRLGFRVQEYGLRNVFRRVPDHPVLAALDDKHLRDWRGESTILPPRLDYERSDRYSGVPGVRWCGLEAPRLWRCGNLGNVASVLIEKPARGDFLPILDGGFSLQYSPLLEYREGRGMVLFCQMDVTGRTESDPAAKRLCANLLDYVADWKPGHEREAVYVGDPAGRTHFESAGVSLGTYEGGALSPDQVLVVGPGGGQALAPHAAAVARWLKAGGHLLALELEAQEANMFLPAPVRTTKQEHIAAYFEPFGAGSLLVGVGPADVHNRDPRELPLVSGGATVVAGGVLGQAESTNVVFCQLTPYSVSKAQGAVPSLAVSGEDAVDGKQSAILTMGTVPWGQLGQKVQAGEAGRTYTFAVFVKGLGEPIRARLEVERAANPWDRAVRGKEILFGANEWTELHVTFKVEKPFPEGWSAYIHCAQEGARFRADLFRLYEGDYVPRRVAAQGAAASAAPGGQNLFTNPSFEAGTEPWSFTYRTQQHNLRQTYRRASFLVTRLLANMGVSGETPLLWRFATPVAEATGESILKNGDFSVDADDNGVPDHWVCHPKDALVREREPADAGRWSMRVTCKGPDEKGKGSVSLAQPDVAVRKGQWYRISLRAKAEGLGGAQITLAVQDTSVWRSLFEYQRFSPDEEWKQFTFLAQSKDTADTKTRFHVWHSNASTVWFSDIRIVPCAPPSQGRWSSGLYLDEPQEWDDPYRFFRW